ncbi:MAG: molecular chaperone DnaJ [Sphingobium sp.]
MGWLALLLLLAAGWLFWTGRLQRMTGRDGLMIGLTLVGAVLAAKGKPVAGALPLLIAAGDWMFRMWRRKAPASRSVPAQPGSDEIARAQALLGLSPGCDAEAVRAAHRRLIAAVHPDRGGSEALAAQINAARDLLLRAQPPQ